MPYKRREAKSNHVKYMFLFYIYYAQENLWKSAREEKAKERGVPDGTGFLFSMPLFFPCHGEEVLSLSTNETKTTAN